MIKALHILTLLLTMGFMLSCASTYEVKALDGQENKEKTSDFWENEYRFNQLNSR